MLGAAARQRARSKSTRVDDTPSRLPPSEATRVAAVVKLAQAKLRKYAELPPGTTMYATSNILERNDRMGSLEGVGIHLHLASIVINADDSVPPEELARFQREGEKAMEKLESGELNNMVLVALYLTIFVSLFVLNVGELSYTAPEPAVFGDPSDDGAWADLATLAWPRDAEARQGLRRGLYVAERVILSAGVTTSLNTLWNAQYLYASWGVGMPSLVAKYEYFLATGTANMTKRMKGMEISGMLLFASLCFVAARASAIASFCSLGGFIIFILRVFDDGWRAGIVADFVRVQHSEARAILAAVARQHEQQAVSQPSKAQRHPVSPCCPA